MQLRSVHSGPIDESMTGSASSIDSGQGKLACLVVLKFPLHWNHHLIKKFSIVYRVTVVFAHEVFLKEGSQGLRHYLQKMADVTKADVILFDLDYYYLF